MRSAEGLSQLIEELREGRIQIEGRSGDTHARSSTAPQRSCVAAPYLRSGAATFDPFEAGADTSEHQGGSIPMNRALARCSSVAGALIWLMAASSVAQAQGSAWLHPSSTVSLPSDGIGVRYRFRSNANAGLG